MPTKPRAESRLGFKLDKKVTAYALAAGAAGVGLTAYTPAAEASVIYTPVRENAVAASPIDINNDGIADFAFILSSYCGHVCVTELIVYGVGSQSTRGSIQEHGWAIARKVGGHVGPQKNFIGQANMAVGETTTSGNFFEDGDWVNVKDRYLGLKFKIGDETHYGWARLNVQVKYDGFKHFQVHAVLTGYAYETEPNKPIMTGDTGQAAGALGRLALGAAKPRRH